MNSNLRDLIAEAEESIKENEQYLADLEELEQNKTLLNEVFGISQNK